MYRYEDLALLGTTLPEDILKKKWAGDFAGALAAIDARLSGTLPEPLRAILRVERELIKRLDSHYTLSRDAALALFFAEVPGATEAEFDALEREGWLDFLYVRGEKMYFKRAVKTLLTAHPGIRARCGKHSAARPLMDEAIARMKRDGAAGLRITLSASLRVKDEAFMPGETYRVYLPLPLEQAQQRNVRILSLSPQAQRVDDAQAAQRTVFFEKTLEKNETFEVTYEYESVMRYIDLSQPLPGEVLYPNCPPPCADDLSELPPHIAFTPYLRALHAQIAGDERDPLRLARRFYDFVTTQVNYSFMRPYFLIESGAEFTAVNLRGDCGLQSLLFITLCRMSGVPARWQSGLSACPGDVGSHDWAQFYLPRCGWLFADCSAGGSAYRAGATERWNFYFGNLDPYRMAANCRYMTQFTPAMQHVRVDPYDNQDGECEIESRSLLGSEVDTAQTMLAHEWIAAV